MGIYYRNTTTQKVTIEKRDDGKKYIQGYAAVYYRKEDEKNTQYRMFPDLVERIKPGAFTDAIKSDDVRALLNHDSNALLARTGNGLKLKSDKVGLWYEFPVDENDPDHDRALAKIERGDMSGSSFGFVPQERKFIEGEDLDIIEITKASLFDVSPCTFPAYSGTSVGLRNNDDLRKEYEHWKERKNEANDLWYFDLEMLRIASNLKR